MRAVVQRVSEASVTIEGRRVAHIRSGLLVLLGISEDDSESDLEWLCGKILKLRIFPDDQGVMNLDVQQVNGDLILVSQFTLLASTNKGNRPSYIRSARPDVAMPLYLRAKQRFCELLGKPIGTGEFGADMKVSLINDGPVTIVIDSKLRE
ncbi:MAG: D-tyrosyl-tRNA(Tyr) deacylase [Flavobacteriales bacterium]|nr:D-tyrosyl-tRNA(Tyr) deacylase [Flavobacteriales bacterium]MBK7241014.1 D-tyrosyl-tRNA(Tyr) deacylase [Flavobacteriales bacterium]MBP9139787.1 D-tyrosyl-tRNA(Tyr) deacylase [Flavobacteriales bacterium]HQX30277.1 D-aminoacyl-tRNA deacylase [Flavobacteriales bacterium]HQX39579.1 D-aminoacyl-tRNA deacylase [Flavobacteriales bacterium]